MPCRPQSPALSDVYAVRRATLPRAREQVGTGLWRTSIKAEFWGCSGVSPRAKDMRYPIVNLRLPPDDGSLKPVLLSAGPYTSEPRANSKSETLSVE